MATRSSTLDILVIGAGQAGLALGYHLKTTSFTFQVVDCHARIGDSWRKRYDSLVLFTPRTYSALPGLVVPGDPEGYPTKDEIADYLETYASHFELPVLGDTPIRWLERTNDGFRATTGTGETIDCRAVVLATGAYQQPALPLISQQLSADILQLSPETYTSPDQVPSGEVLVVGDGATGRQIARECRRQIPDESRSLSRQSVGTQAARATRGGRGWSPDTGGWQARHLRKPKNGRSGDGDLGDRVSRKHRLDRHSRGQGCPGKPTAPTRCLPGATPVCNWTKLAMDAWLGPTHRGRRRCGSDKGSHRERRRQEGTT
jgi:cation diffusion facilitator CzcD-associated flavoprotein CzcO